MRILRRAASLAEAVASVVLFRAIWLGAIVALRIFFAFRVEGRPRLRGPALLAANHVSFLDPVVLQAALRRRVTYLMTERYWRLPWANWFFRMMRTLPLSDEGGNRESIALTLRALRRGEVVGIFPEGTRSLDGRLLPGEPGVGALALRAGVPVVPVAILGTGRALPPRARRIRLARIRVRFGEALQFGYEGDSPRRDAARRATDALMGAIAALLGQKSP